MIIFSESNDETIEDEEEENEENEMTDEENPEDDTDVDLESETAQSGIDESHDGGEDPEYATLKTKNDNIV